MKDARALLREAGLSPKKSFGQNFLVNEGITERIAEACVPEDERGRARVVEIGAGTGALTARLAARARSVAAVERDRDLVPILQRAMPENVEIIEGDAQTVDLRSLLGDETPRVLCGNLPYQLTGRLLRRATELVQNLERAVFMVQEEVADRLEAEPRSKDYGALTVFVRAAFDVRRVVTVSRGSFHPPPDVTSAVVELRPHVVAEETPAFQRLVKAAFEMRRKTLRNAWSKLGVEEAAKAAGIDLERRGETLSVEEFARVASGITDPGGPAAPPGDQGDCGARR
jgi:16S rRNA (adenine1518-N6/adenine1519-N6)-dimethyltransferase